MKRKIFSKLLMGAFLIASVSSFVSCKDYDDDINNLQKQIDAAALKAELTTLQTNLAAQIAAAQSAAQAAQAAAEKAQATANNAATKDALEAVKTLATAAGTDAAKAIADAANAQNTADVAKSAATAAQEAAAAAQNVANGASDKAATALADAAKALATAEAASATATAANATASAADATAKEAKATADNAIAAAGNATTQAADAVKAAGEAKAAAEAAKYNDEAVKLLIAQAQASADAAAQDAKDAAEAAAAAVLASASATEDAATAKDAAAKAEETIATAIAEATKAIEEATDAKIKTAVAEAVAKIPTDQSEAVAEQAAAIETLKGNLQTLADAQGKLATAEGLAAAVEDLEGKLDATAEAAAIAAVAAAAGTIEEAFGALYTAVTSVELVGTFSGNYDKDVVSFPLGYTAASTLSSGVNLDFIFGKQAWTATFGDKETESGLSQTSGAIEGFDGVEKVSYVEGDDIRADRALLVRVNPTNASFTKDQVKLINSQLGNLDEIVEILDPYRYEGLITRSEMESGLWVIPVKVAKGKDEKAFNSVTFKGRTYNADGTVKNTGKAICYAVAINNTTDPEDAEVSRYVASTYDIKAEWKKYTPATKLTAEFYDGTGKYQKQIAQIHNRWTNNVGNSENKEGILSKDQVVAYTLLNPEKCWARAGQYATNSNEYKAGLRIPSAEPMKAKVNNKDTWNTVNANGGSWDNDQRYGQPFYTIEKYGEVITVKLPDGNNSSNTLTSLQDKVEYWYITYDFQLNAVESSPSEWEAWLSYKDNIQGLYKMTRGAEPIDLVINDEDAQGDVIGFRIWAVNYDGSLVDPDGKAFYVKIGEEPDGIKATATVNIFAQDEKKGLPTKLEDKDVKKENGWNVSVVTDLKFKSGESFASLVLGTDPNGKAVKFSDVTTFAKADYPNVLNADIKIMWQILDANGNPATNWKDAKSVKASIDGAQLKNFRDDYDVTLPLIQQKRTDAYNKELYQISITFHKEMPSDDFTKESFKNKITWKSDYDASTGILTVYPKPYYSATSKVLEPYFVAGTWPAPDYFRWNYNGTAQNLIDFINDANWCNWKYDVNPEFANAGVREISDYIASVDPSVKKSLYKWIIKGLPTGLKKADGSDVANQNYVSQWSGTAADDEKGNYSVIAVLPKVVREGGEFASELKYTYENISLLPATFKSNNVDVATWSGNHNLDKAAWTFKTVFKDAMDLLTYTTKMPYLAYDVWGSNGVAAIVTDTKYMVDDKLYIDWLGTNGGTNLALYPVNKDFDANLFHLGLTDMRYSAGVVGKTLSQEFNPNTYDKYSKLGTGSYVLPSFMSSSITEPNKVLAENKSMITNVYNGAGIDNDVTGNKFAFNENYYKFDNPDRKTTDPVVKDMKIELEGEIATYLKVSDNATLNHVIFQKIGGVQDPHDYIDGYIKVSGYDVFGKKQNVVTIPVRILYNK